MPGQQRHRTFGDGGDEFDEEYEKESNEARRDASRVNQKSIR